MKVIELENKYTENGRCLRLIKVVDDFNHVRYCVLYAKDMNEVHVKIINALRHSHKLRQDAITQFQSIS